MNDEEEVVVISSNEQEEQPEQRQQKPRRSVKDTIDDTRQKVDNFGKKVENIGKVEEKAADFIDGGEKATKGVANVGKATSSAAEAGSKISEGAAKAQKAAAQAEKAAAEATKAGAEATKAGATATKTGATATKAGGKAVSTAGDAINAAGTAADAAYGAGIPANVAGTAMSVGGKIADAASTATIAGADATIAGAEATKAGAETAKAGADAQIAAADAQLAGAKASQAAAKTGKGAGEAAKKASDNTFADKLRERGKLNQARGRRIQDLANKFDSKEFFEKTTDELGKIGKVLKGVAKLFNPATIIAIFLLLIILGTLLISYILSPMFFMRLINETVADPDNVEKVSNYISGLGFQNSKNAFYNEVNYLNTHYNNQLDFSYVMSTLYYTDIYYGDTGVYTNDVDNVCESFDLKDEKQKKVCETIQMGISLGKMWVKEATTTTGDDGLVYSANKIYRLRDLAKHQFLGDKNIQTKNLNEYIEYCFQNIGNETKNMMQYLPLLVAYAVAHVNKGTGEIFDKMMIAYDSGKFINDIVGIFEGTESWKSIKVYFNSGKYDSGIKEALENFIATFFGCIFNIESVSIKGNPFDVILSSIIAAIASYNASDKIDISPVTNVIGSFITVNYYEFSYDEEKFEEYLLNDYIPNMPEFSKLLKDSNGKKLKGDALKNRVKQIAYEIKMAKSTFDSLYQTDESAQENGICIGDIDLDLLTELTPPVSLTIGQTITFYGSNNYGLQKGVIHNGVDLDEDSTNTKKGDDVFSIYDGKVYSSTVDKTFEDSTAKGGWVVIDYTVQYSDATQGNGEISKLFKNKLSKIRVYYGGIDTSTLTLKQGDAVKKGQVIGKVGDASVSENGKKASLHFAIYDLKRGTFLNPVNMFITCSDVGSGITACDNSGGLVIELPDSVLQLSQNNYTVTCYNKTGWVYSIDKGKTCTNEKTVAKSSLQRKVHDIWKENGAKYKNSIAVLTVNGVERYLVAVTEKFGKSGDLIDATLENGETIKMVIADIKSYEHTGVTDAKLCKNSSISDPGCYGHVDGKKLSVLEFEYDPNAYNNGKKNPGALDQEWTTSQKVKSITRYGSILGDSYSDTTCGEQNDTTDTSTKTYDSSSRSNSCNDYTSKGKDACNKGSTSTNKCTWEAIPGGDKGYCKDGEKIKRKCTEYGLNKGFTCPTVDDYGTACIEIKTTDSSKPSCDVNENAKKCSVKSISECKGKDDYGSKCEWKDNKCISVNN